MITPLSIIARFGKNRCYLRPVCVSIQAPNVTRAGTRSQSHIDFTATAARVGRGYKACEGHKTHYLNSLLILQHMRPLARFPGKIHMKIGGAKLLQSTTREGFLPFMMTSSCAFVFPFVWSPSLCVLCPRALTLSQPSTLALARQHTHKRGQS